MYMLFNMSFKPAFHFSLLVHLNLDELWVRCFIATIANCCPIGQHGSRTLLWNYQNLLHYLLLCLFFSKHVLSPKRMIAAINMIPLYRRLMKNAHINYLGEVPGFTLLFYSPLSCTISGCSRNTWWKNKVMNFSKWTGMRGDEWNDPNMPWWQ